MISKNGSVYSKQACEYLSTWTDITEQKRKKPIVKKKIECLNVHEAYLKNFQCAITEL